MLSEGLSCLKYQGHPCNLPGTKQGWEGHLPLCYLQLVLMACQEVKDSCGDFRGKEGLRRPAHSCCSDPFPLRRMSCG